MWWKYFSVIVAALARDFNFNVVKLTNDDYKTLNETMRNATGGTFIVGASFPTENIDFPIDYHIHIKLSPKLLTKVINEHLDANPEIQRMMIDEQLSNTAKSIMFNRINKTITYDEDYEKKQDEMYRLIINPIFENIEKKLYTKPIKQNKEEEPTGIDKELPTQTVDDLKTTNKRGDAYGTVEEIAIEDPKMDEFSGGGDMVYVKIIKQPNFDTKKLLSKISQGQNIYYNDKKDRIMMKLNVSNKKKFLDNLNKVIKHYKIQSYNINY